MESVVRETWTTRDFRLESGALLFLEGLHR